MRHTTVAALLSGVAFFVFRRRDRAGRRRTRRRVLRASTQRESDPVARWGTFSHCSE